MPLPERSYYHLSEIAERWGVSKSDLACYANDNLLEISIMAIAIPVEIGTIEEDERGIFLRSDGVEILNGLQPLFSSDLWFSVP